MTRRKIAKKQAKLELEKLVPSTPATSQNRLALNELAAHFKTVPLPHLVTACREFPIAAQVDLHTALTYLLSETYPARLLGIHRMNTRSTLTFSDLLNTEYDPVLLAPLQHREIDIGDLVPARCLRQGLWLCRDGDLAFSVLLSPVDRQGRDAGSQVEIAVPPGEEGAKLSRALLGYVEKLVNEGRSYRGKIISLEASDQSGNSGAVKVHKVRTVTRNEVILPEKTLTLLEENVVNFVHHRESLKKLGMAAKKGLLLYGPPGAGKTHTIHYLASQLPGHTTLLVTAEQVGLLEQYFQLARLLAPTMLVIEDVDLIARTRSATTGACDERLINKLLNEMEALQEDTATLFLLTTNRPEQLETALASRPGLIDQAIEVPLPDEKGRRQLVRLYARGLKVSDELVEAIATKTNRASGAFIKELMRRAAQYFLQSGDPGKLALKHVDAALDEMLFRGGSLNLKLLGVTNESESPFVIALPSR